MSDKCNCNDCCACLSPVPDGCKSCAHFQRCGWLLSRRGEETECDWIPSKYRPHPKEPQGDD